MTGQFGRRTSGPLTPPPGSQSNPDWGNESPESSIPPSGGFGGRRSGLMGSPSSSIPPTRRTGGFSSSPSWQRATDPTPPPPSGRGSGRLSNPARAGGADAGNRSASWKWQSPSASLSGAGLTRQESEESYNDGYGSGEYGNGAYGDGGYGDAGYGDAGYEQAEPPAQPSGNLRRSSMLPVPYQTSRRAWDQQEADYEGMDEEGSSSNLPAPMGMGQGSGAFPMLSEEALASRIPPGRKPPAFIPATRPRRPYRLSSYRVISGTVSVGLVLLLVIGSLSFLAIKTGALQHLLAGKSLPPISYHFPQPTLPALGATPQATPSGNQAAQMISRVTTAKNYSGNYDPINITTTFKPGETVNVLWQVKGSKANDVISVKWYQNGSVITGLDSKSTQEAFKNAGDWNGVFGLAYPTVSVGKAELYYNGQLGWSIEFIIANPAPPTKTPAPATTQTPAVVPTQTP